MDLVLDIAWLVLPGGFANMAPVFARRLLPSWTTPVDGGRSWGGARIFGDHKTFRGLVSGTLVGMVVFMAQQALYARFEPLRAVSRMDYAAASWTWGAAMGLGALTGDLIKSFFKRRVGREPGQPWFPFDQLDWMAGTLLVAWPATRFDAPFAALALTLAVAISLIVKFVGFRLGVEDRPF